MLIMKILILNKSFHISKHKLYTRYKFQNTGEIKQLCTKMYPKSKLSDVLFLHMKSIIFENDWYFI